ncbi:MAG TPA: hypothetical protein VF574_18165 [Allosphingosinicella sp.]|jgi:hypothetical protein
MPIELPGIDSRFEDSLAEEQGWTVGFAERVTDEYRRFLYLAATAGFEVTPSRSVDEAWHLHLTSPHYREILCERILGRPLEHRPASGLPGEEERHHRQYEDTVALYERAFLRPPPSDIWPRAPSPEAQEAARKGRRGRRLAIATAGAAVAGAAATQVAGLGALTMALAGTALIFLLLSLPFGPGEARSRRNDGGAGCGGSCGGSGHDGGCGAGCGGGCGGGCGS